MGEMYEEENAKIREFADAVMNLCGENRDAVGEYGLSERIVKHGNLDLVKRTITIELSDETHQRAKQWFN